MSTLFTKQLIAFCLLPVLIVNNEIKNSHFNKTPGSITIQKPIVITIEDHMIIGDSNIRFLIKISSQENIASFIWNNSRGGSGQPPIRSDNLKELELPLIVKMKPGNNIFRFTVTDIKHHTASVNSSSFNYSMAQQPVAIRAAIQPVKLNPTKMGRPIVIIGEQEWTVKNLDCITYNNGDLIPEITDPTTWSTLTSGAWCHYNNDPANDAVYGKLYNWYAVNDPRGLAPKGWHVPTRNDWITLTNTLGDFMVAGGRLKSTNGSYWRIPNTAANNNTGFTALPGGMRAYTGSFAELGYYGTWWTSSEFGMLNAFSVSLSSEDGLIEFESFDKGNGFSIRCIKN